ncbi:hypothetical protein AC249_AIPGENE358 [Exaiptasia diaphana]|nr:hypothetical protein AC249_AIPGENE358 [Exaiptasia diaphana]
MGSPVSVVVANLVMEDLETRAIATYHTPPSLYRRYVDDTACVIKKADVGSFHKHLKEQEDNMTFTVERYSDGGLPFLDCLNLVKEDGTIDVNVYRKKTHTDRYLDFHSHHPVQHKVSVVRTLFSRAETVPSSEPNKDRERKHLTISLHEQNCYPKRFLSKYKKARQRNSSQHDEVKGYASLPYVKGVSERVQQHHNFKTTLKPVKSLRQILSKPIYKDTILMSKRTGVVYNIPCKDWSQKEGKNKELLRSDRVENLTRYPKFDAIRLR